MKHFTYLVALVLLCIQNEGFGVPIEISENGKQLIYSYMGYTDTASNADNDTIARWSLEGKLTVQTFSKFWIFQLSEVKTSLFTGSKENVTSTTFEEIPKEAEELLNPFVLNTETNSISVDAEEPLWSLNFKRGIASNFKTTSKGLHNEKSVFGNCETITELNENGWFVKKINHDSCKGVHFEHNTNVKPALSSENYNPIKIETTYEIIPNSNHQNIHVVSSITYQPMPKDPYNQFSFQKQEFNFKTESVEFTRINTQSLTEEKKIFFEYGKSSTQGRHKYETDAKVLTKQYLNSYDEFEKEFNKRPLENHRTTEDHVDDMYHALYNMPNIEGMNYLREKIKNKGHWKLYSSFISLIPYVGTNEAIKHIFDGVINADLEVIPFYAIRLLATFPQYIREPTNELVQSLEGMLEVKNVNSFTARSCKILSFASVVAKARKEKYLSEENFEKYTTIFHKNFLENEYYEAKMMYLLGLINMADGLTTDFISTIITNNTLPNNIRSLALVGFKTKLAHGDVGQIFHTFWPIVLNKKENFDVRVEALDLLLSLNLNEDQFNVILNKFKKYQTNEIYEKHLANYYRSTLESLQNNTAYKHPLGDLATAAIANEKFEGKIRPWTTGNYLLSFSDKQPNIGAYFHARLIANPILNTPSTIQLSFNEFAWSFDMGTYSIYLKVQGAIEFLFKQHIFKYLRSEDVTIPQIVKLIKDFKFEMKQQQQKFHIDVIVFTDNRAVFASYLNNENFNFKLSEFGIMFEGMVRDSFTISYPVSDYVQMPSIMGTPIMITNDRQDINSFKYDYRQSDLKIRSSWYYQIWLDSYNPILDTTVSNYKYYGDEKSIDTLISINTPKLLVAWVTKNDSVNWAWDRIIASTVDDVALLHKFCPNCDEVSEVPMNYETAYIRNFDKFGMKFNVTKEKFFVDNYNFENELDNEEDFLLDFRNIHCSNAHAIPHAKPLLAISHFFANWFYLKPEVKRVLYRNFPVLEEGVQTRIRFDLQGQKLFTDITDPFEDFHRKFTFNIMNKGLKGNLLNNENYISNLLLQYEYNTTHNYSDEHGEQKVKRTENIDFTNEVDEVISHICASREAVLPAARSDKFSILPPEDTKIVNVIHFDKISNETEWETNQCSDNQTATITQEFTTLEERIKKYKESEDHKKCLDESKEFKYTPPTSACFKTFIAASQYDKLTISVKLNNISNINDEELNDNALFVAERTEDDKIKYSFLLSVLALGGNHSKYFDFTTYNPMKLKDPSADVYADYDVKSGLKRSCVISPNKIRSFTGHNINFKEDTEQVAFVECFEKGRRGLTFNRISPTHVGFKFWSGENVVEATFDENKLKVTLDGDIITETANINKLRVRFLEDDVIFVSDNIISIYYNTEYIYIKAAAIYNDIICGDCTKH